jgi:hypothetical protein
MLEIANGPAIRQKIRRNRLKYGRYADVLQFSDE